MNKILRRLPLVILAMLFLQATVTANGMADFSVRESAREGNSMELVALDAAGNRLDKLSGRFPFSVNGFEVELEFRDGLAFFPRDVATSTFIYLKYKGESANSTRLYYVYQERAGGFNIIHIPLVLLVAIPLGLVLLGTIFRRLIMLSLVLLAAFFYFNSTKGLSLGDFFDAAGEWISSLLQMIVGS